MGISLGGALGGCMQAGRGGWYVGWHVGMVRRTVRKVERGVMRGVVRGVATQGFQRVAALRNAWESGVKSKDNVEVAFFGFFLPGRTSMAQAGAFL